MEQQNVTPIYFVSLGCDKNLVDSEMMITSLREQGFRLVNEETEAEVIVVNTCCFIGGCQGRKYQYIVRNGVLQGNS